MEGKSSFALIFGNSPIVKVLDFFIENREFDYILTDIARNSDIGWSTLHKFWEDLVRLEVVSPTRRIGRAELYRLNLNNPLVKKLIEMDNEISRKLIQQELISQKRKVKTF